MSNPSQIAAMAGDPARASMLQALMDGRALTATELARAAGIVPQTASGHLARLVDSGLLQVTKQGRHRYHRLASPMVAQMIETMMHLVTENPGPRRPAFVGPRDQALRRARTCYDHLAGQLGVAVTDTMVARGYAEIGNDSGLVTETGRIFLDRIGIDTAALLARRTRAGGQLLCRPCLDWSERRPHLAGAVGAAICRHCLAAEWVRRMDGTRAVAITPHGQRIFRETFGLALP